MHIKNWFIFGPGLKRQFIYDACKKISKKQSQFFGTERGRDWLYVDDLALLIYKIFKNKKFYECFNVGYGKGIKIEHVIKKLLLNEN